MKQQNKTKIIEQIDSKYFVTFIKIFLLYIFLEYFLTNLGDSVNYQYTIKFLGDFLLIVFAIFTMIKTRKMHLYPAQKYSFIFLFIMLAVISTLENRIDAVNLFLGLRSLFRYYLIYFFSFYYDLGRADFNKICNFLVASFYFEFILFFFHYFFLGTTDVLSHSYLVQALYLNAVFSIVLFRGKFNTQNLIIILLLAIQAFLSTSRLALLGLALQALIFIFFIWKRNIAAKAAVTAGLAMIILAIFISPLGNQIVNSEQYNKLNDLSMDTDSESNFRLYLLYHFTDISIQNTNLIGDGPNTFGSLYTRQYDPEYYYQYDFTDETIPYAADSDYTNLLMQYGFIGLILFYAFLFVFYLHTAPEYKPLLMMYLGFIVFASFAIPVFSMRLSSFWIFTLLAITQNAKFNKKINTQNENTNS